MNRLILLIFSCLITTKLVFAANSDVELSVWVNEAIVSTYTYNYQNFLDRQREVAHYFTPQGWINYSKALEDSKLPDAVQKNQYYVSAVALLPPVVTNLDATHWKATMPLLVLYKNSKYDQKQTLNITITFQKVSASQGIRGLAITGLQTKVITEPCKCTNEKDNIALT